MNESGEGKKKAKAAERNARYTEGAYKKRT
jgi:hypothetical protein